MSLDTHTRVQINFLSMPLQESFCRSVKLVMVLLLLLWLVVGVIVFTAFVAATSCVGDCITFYRR